MRSAVIGLGVGAQHALTFMNLKTTELAAICDIDPSQCDLFKKQYQCDFLIKTFDEILCDQQIELVSIASFDDQHYEQVIACLEAGKHVFVEKPLCQNKTATKTYS